MNKIFLIVLIVSVVITTLIKTIEEGIKEGKKKITIISETITSISLNIVAVLLSYNIALYYELPENLCLSIGALFGIIGGKFISSKVDKLIDGLINKWTK